jgi:hypothetical protein
MTSSVQEVKVSKDSETTQSTLAQDSLTLNYASQTVVERTLTTSHLQQQMQTPVSNPIQGSSNQSGAGTGQSTPTPTNKK